MGLFGGRLWIVGWNCREGGVVKGFGREVRVCLI